MDRLLMTAAVAFPLLMIYPNPMPWSEWNNSILMAGYMGTYLHDHGEFPLRLDFEDSGGAPYPVFYGPLFYKLLGCCCVWLSPEFVLRLAVIALFALQFHVIRKTLLLLGTTDGLAMTVACLVVWAIYPLSNLYHRGAMPELFATGLLTCMVGYWFQILLAMSWKELLPRALNFGLCFTVAAGTHPITALYSVIVLLTLLLTFAWRPPGVTRLAMLGNLTVVGSLAAIVLIPWVYALWPVRPYLWISREAVWSMAMFADSIDSWYARLLPIPFDIRMLFLDYNDVGTPYLHAPINGALIVLTAAACATSWPTLSRRERIVVLAYAAAAMLFLILSLDADLMMMAPRLFQMVQFMYRLVTYVNLMVLLALLALLYVLRLQLKQLEPLSPVLVCFVLTLAGCAVVDKLLVAYPARRPENVPTWWPRVFETDWSRLRYRKAGKYLEPVQIAYATPSFYTWWGTALTGRRDDPDPHPFELAPPGKEPGFGCYLPLHLNMPEGRWVRNQIKVFPWCHFYLDGERIPDDQMMCWRPYTPNAVMWIPAGEHTLTYRFEPDPTYVLLNRISTVTLFTWIGTVAMLHVWSWRRRRRAAVVETAGVAEPAPGIAAASAVHTSA